jgi:hypothetical protein
MYKGYRTWFKHMYVQFLARRGVKAKEDKKWDYWKKIQMSICHK